jgi:hypothetical protein
MRFSDGAEPTTPLWRPLALSLEAPPDGHDPPATRSGPELLRAFLDFAFGD